MTTTPHPSAMTRAERMRTPLDRRGEMMRLSPADWWLLDMLTEHEVLTTEQITQLGYAPTLVKAANRLQMLASRLVLASFVIDGAGDPHHRKNGRGAPVCWCLGSTGAQIAALRTCAAIPRPATTAARVRRLASSPHTARRVTANGFFADLAGWVRTHPGTDLREWWSPHGCLPVTGTSLYPKRYGYFFDHGHGVNFWLELDTSNTPLGRLVTKLDGYRRLADMTGVATVLVWMPNASRERHLHQHLTKQPGRDLTIVTATVGSGTPADKLWRIAGTEGRITLSGMPANPRLLHPYCDASWWDERVIHRPVHPIHDPDRPYDEFIIDQYDKNLGWTGTIAYPDAGHGPWSVG